MRRRLVLFCMKKFDPKIYSYKKGDKVKIKKADFEREFNEVQPFISELNKV